MSDEELERSLGDMLHALAWLAAQYMQDDDGSLWHSFMSANERCLEILEEHGLVKGFKFTEKGRFVMESR